MKSVQHDLSNIHNLILKQVETEIAIYINRNVKPKNLTLKRFILIAINQYIYKMRNDNETSKR